MSENRPIRPRRLAGASIAIAGSSVLLSGCFAIPGLGGGGGVGYDGKDPSQIQSATVRIYGQGTYIEPGTLDPSEVGFTGSGFFVSSDGYIVTNDHVVSGAGVLTVEVGGNASKQYTATVVGSTECYDLGVLKINGYDGATPYFDWQSDQITVGQTVMALGFPDGTTDFTLTKGVVNKADTGVQTDHAYLQHGVEMDADSRHGNSGGPLVNESGKLVGVVFAGTDDTNNYNFGISKVTAQDIIAQLKAGKAPLTLGLNTSYLGLAEDGSPQGIWVSSVTPGSPGDKAGIKPGDVLSKLGGVTMGANGTKDYCDVLTTQGTDKAIDVEVLRPGTGELLKGQINGTQLAVSGKLNGGGGGDQLIGSYVKAQSDDGRLWVNKVPDTWTDVASQATDAGGEVLYAAPDLDAFDALQGSGLQFIGYPYGTYSVDEAASAFTGSFESAGCSIDAANRGADASDDYASGKIWTYTCDLGSTKAAFVILAFDLLDHSASGLIQVSIFPGDSGDPATTIENIATTFGLRGFGS